MAPPPPELVIDVIAEILLRIPPHEPKCLFRAALVCKPWLRTITDPAFLRRYRAFHGTPPLLGLIIKDQPMNRIQGPSYLPTTAVPASPLPGPDAGSDSGSPATAATAASSSARFEETWRRYYSCFVYDTVMGDRHPVPLPEIGTEWMVNFCSACVVFCAATGCEHLDCHGGPFYVATLVSNYSTGTMLAAVYSSEKGAWSEPATLQGFGEIYGCGRGAVIRNEIYFMLSKDNGIAKHDLGKNCLSVVKPPPSAFYNGRFVVMVVEGSSLGLAGIEQSSLYLWSRKVSSEGTAEWILCRVIDLDNMMPMANSSDGASVVGFAEGVGVIFVRTRVGLFMMDLKSGRVRKVNNPGINSGIPLPYMSFYTPDRLDWRH